MESQTRSDIEAHTLGRYRLIAALGHGGMAVVHLAVMHGQAGFNKLLVIKQIHERYAADPEVLGMFLDEARLAARLSHPNVVQTNEVGQDGDRHFLAMEYLDGQPLNRITWRMSRRGGLPLGMHLRILADVLGGLHYAHELADYSGAPLGVVHRDVTPQNVFVTYDGTVKVVDFGIAKARNSVTQTKIGTIKGKIAYMAPEQARGGTVDRGADIFAAGVMLWEAVTGTRPWQGVPELTILKSLFAGEFPSARAVKPELPAQLEAILVKALASDRRDRYATAAEFQADLETYLETTGRRPEQRELGQLLSTHFEAERAAIKTIIEDQLRSDDGDRRGSLDLPVIENPTTSGSELADEPIVVPLPLPGPIAHAPHGPSQFAINVPTTFLKRPRRWPGLLGRAGLLLAGAAVFTAIGISMRRAPPKAEASPPAVSATQLAPTVQIRLSALPPEARMFFDGMPLAGNPWNGARPRDGLEHRIRVEAPGFVPWTESVTLNKDWLFDVVLTSSPSLPSAEPASAQRAVVSEYRSPPDPSSKRRSIDPKNPYTR
jgi:eukaryotic-like serine/threonine-protein kinase